MKGHSGICTLMIIATLAGGCSTRPREFSATLNPPAADVATYDHDFGVCRALVRNGVKSGFKDAAVMTGVGVAGAFGTGAAMAGAGAVGIGMSGGAAAAATAGLLIVPIGLGFGVSRMIRSGRERRQKVAMENCLAEYGYTPTGWTVVKRIKTAKTQTVGR